MSRNLTSGPTHDLAAMRHGSAELFEDAIATYGSEGELLGANHAWLALLASRDWLLAHGNELLFNLLGRLAQDEACSAQADIADGSGGRRSYALGARRLLDTAGNRAGAVLTWRDTTRLNQAKEEVAGLRAKLMAVSQELDSLSYSISHDLRAPLRAIDGYSDILARRASDRLDDEDRRLLGVVRSSCQTMRRLFDRLLALSGLSQQPVSVVTADMTSLARDAWLDVGQTFSGEFQVDELPTVRGDRSLLKQVWVQLLGNAIKYSAQNPAPRIEVLGWREGDECIYRVRDNGVGFDMRYAAKLFNVFQRLHGADEFPGDGIGLAIVARIISRHGGRVWVESERGVGASFYFALPREAALSLAGNAARPDGFPAP